MTEAELPSQSVGKRTVGQSQIGPRNANPRTTRREDLPRYVSCRSADRQDIGIGHRLNVGGEAGVIGRQRVLGYSKHAGKELALRVEPCSFCPSERSENKIMCDESTVAQRPVDPPQRRDIVSAVWRSRPKRTNGFRK